MLNIVLAAVVFLFSLGLAHILKFFLTRFGPDIVSRTSTTLDDEILKAVNGPLQLLVIALGAYAAARMMTGGAYGQLDAALVVVTIFIAAYLISNLTMAVMGWYQKGLDKGTGSRLDTSLISFVKRLSSAAIYAMAILIALSQFMDITPLVASLGILGIAVALAAQELLSNVFGAIAILADRPYKIGDRIELSDGEYGDVIDIGLRSTRIRTLDNKIIIIPNADISKSRINNYSEPNSILRYMMKIGISYDSDVEKASKILLNIADCIEGALKDPAPLVYIDGLGDYSVNLVMLVWGRDFRKNWDIPDKIYRQALKRFAAEGIVIPYPIMSVSLDDKKHQRSMMPDILEK